jgi:hypothetical protein
MCSAEHKSNMMPSSAEHVSLHRRRGREKRMMNARGSDDEAEDKDKEVDKTDTTVMAMR